MRICKVYLTVLVASIKNCVVSVWCLKLFPSVSTALGLCYLLQTAPKEPQRVIKQLFTRGECQRSSSLITADTRQHKTAEEIDIKQEKFPLHNQVNMK